MANYYQSKIANINKSGENIDQQEQNIDEYIPNTIENSESSLNSVDSIESSIDIISQDYSSNEQEYSEGNGNDNSSDNNNRTNKINTDSSIYVNIPKSYASHKKCVICLRGNLKLTVIPMNAIALAYFKTNILIPKNARCCHSHFTEDKSRLKEEAMDDLVPHSNQIQVNGIYLLDLLGALRNIFINKSLFEKFKNSSIVENDDCIQFSGFSKNDFKIIEESLINMRNSNERSISQALAVYLCWMKRNVDQTFLATIFGISQRDVSRYCQQIRESLMNNFVKNNLGASSLNRDDFLNNNTDIVKRLFFDNSDSDQLAIIADGTYCYIQKSSNNDFQRKTYSCQKKRHLIKPFVICTTNGYIVDIYGSYGASANDASILQHVLNTDTDLVSLLKPNDVVLLDRGFRDCVKTLKQKYKLKPYLPTCKIIIIKV